MAQEGALWLSLMVTLGPCWHKGPMLVAPSDVGSNISVIHCNWLYGAIKTILAQL